MNTPGRNSYSFDVFISYASKDNAIADQICNYLEDNGVRCWIAPRNVRPGYLYGAEIVSAIKLCKALILVYSGTSNTSKHVINEIDIAFGKNKIIIPFKIEDVPMTDSMEYYLNNKHWIDATHDMHDLLKTLLTQCERLSIEADYGQITINDIDQFEKEHDSHADKSKLHNDRWQQSARSGHFTDPRDGNQYKWVKIGNQIWMAENLRYIPHISPKNIESGVWVYGYEGWDINEAKQTTYYKDYGCLYDLESARKLCPSGWHLPSNDEWLELTDYIGGAEIAGGKLKEKGTKHWNFANEEDKNIFGFSALPAGSRNENSRFDIVGQDGIWWSNSEYRKNVGWNWSINCKSSIFYRSTSGIWHGFSVRYVKDS